MFSGSRFGPIETGVPCPECKEGDLFGRFTCLTASFVCERCHVAFSLDQLVPVISDAQFEVLEQVVSSRLSDRI